MTKIHGGFVHRVMRRGRLHNQCIRARSWFSLQWTKVFWKGDDGFLHIAILDSHDIGPSLLLLNEASATLKATMRHSTLLTTIENDGDAVTDCI